MKTENPFEQIFNTTIELYDPMIKRVCRTYANAYVTVDDLYQEVMATVWLGLKSFRGKSSMSTWIYRVCINTCISYLRRHCRQQYNLSIDSLDTPFPELEDKDASAENAENAEVLKYLIGRLKPLDKAILMMWMDERSYSEISDVTGLSLSAVGVRLNRIRAILRQKWQKIENLTETR